MAREEAQSKQEGPVRTRIRETLEKRLAGQAVEVWPRRSQDIPDGEPRFLVGYLPLEFAGEPRAEQEKLAKEFFSNYGDRPRRYRNGLGLAIPDKKQIETLRRAVRYLVAIERVEAKKQQLRLSRDQLDQLRERRRTEEAAAESALRSLYGAVWLPRMQEGRIEVERVEIGGRPLQATGVHERVMELLTSVGAPRLHGTLKPHKIRERMRLGESVAPGEPLRPGVKTADVVEAFYSFLEPPRLETANAVCGAISRGVVEGMFAYTTGTPSLGQDGLFQVSLDRIVQRQFIPEDEIDLDSGFLMLPQAVPVPPRPEACSRCGLALPL